jgi:hypothetical protein
MSWIGGAKSSHTGKTVKARTPAPVAAPAQASRPVPPKPVAPATPAQAPSLESPIVVRARGMSPANAIVEHVTAHECRLRSVVMFDMGATIEFELSLPDRPTHTILGRIASRTPNGPRFIYKVGLERMSPSQTDELAATLAHTHRAQTRLRNVATLKELPTTDGLTRKQLRSEAEFPLQYRTAKEGFRGGKAANISTGGLLLTCSDALVEGMYVELHFTLPSDVLDVYPEETAVLDLRNPLKRKVVPSKLRKPFEDMVVHARVAFHEVHGNGVYSYGLSFAGLERTEREEIARYVDAVRHEKLRRGHRH